MSDQSISVMIFMVKDTLSHSREYPFPQAPHLNGFSFVCERTWR